MAAWQYQLSGTKSAVATALNVATIADAVDMDAPTEDLVGNTAGYGSFQRGDRERAISVECVDQQCAKR